MWGIRSDKRLMVTGVFKNQFELIEGLVRRYSGIEAVYLRGKPGFMLVAGCTMTIEDPDLTIRMRAIVHFCLGILFVHVE